jgi:molybdenum cofactor cytidylyltransferase
MGHSIQHCGILIIAAGESKRLGQPKQLLMLDGQSLINRLIEKVKQAGDFPITLVLGANADQIQQQLNHSNLHIVLNTDWQEGMASSIRVGLAQMVQEQTNSTQKNIQIDGIMILVCDQPFINPTHIQSLLQIQQQTKQPIAACYYAQVLGTPALFHASIFHDLMALEGDTGAKKIINAREEEVAKLHFEKGIIDIDTIEDYHKLIIKQEATDND